MDTPKIFGGAAACLIGAAVITFLIHGAFSGFCVLAGVCIALYCFLKILNGYEARDIQQRKRRGGRRGRT